MAAVAALIEGCATAATVLVAWAAVGVATALLILRSAVGVALAAVVLITVLAVTNATSRVVEELSTGWVGLAKAVPDETISVTLGMVATTTVELTSDGTSAPGSNSAVQYELSKSGGAVMLRLSSSDTELSGREPPRSCGWAVLVGSR